MIYAHNDPKFWGKQIQMAAGRLGIECSLFNVPDEVPANGLAFVRMDQQGNQRIKCKRIVEGLTRKGVHTLPCSTMAHLYDDKEYQRQAMSQYMPRTAYLTTLQQAEDYLPTMDYPFVSKSREGSGSANIRLVKNPKQARSEILSTLQRGAAGLPMSYDRRQKGYLLWQDFVPGNTHDCRVCIIGRHAFGLMRENRADVPFASGSGVATPLTLATERERIAVMRAAEISDHLNSYLVAYDFVFDHGEPVLLEVSSSWTPYAYALCPTFDIRSQARMPATGGHMFDLIVEHMRELGQ